MNLHSSRRRPDGAAPGGSEATAHRPGAIPGATASLARGVPSPEETARGLSISARTLSRYLGAAGTSHQRLLDEVRARLAHRYLVDDGRPVDEVARMLGYSEVSAFRRAFRRWYGRPPADYRASPHRGKRHP